MSKKFPIAEANKITMLLDELGHPFPRNIKEIAVEISKNQNPDEPITKVEAWDLNENIDGSIHRFVRKKTGETRWGIMTNRNQSPQRQNFTAAHEFGHYVLHRWEPGVLRGNKIECNSKDTTYNYENAEIEREANQFASHLLMPLNDFRKQIDTKKIPNLLEIERCSKRYGTSVLATLLQWVHVTETRTMVVAHTKHQIQWGVSSSVAYKSGIYIKKSQNPESIPEKTKEAMKTGRNTITHEDKTVYKESSIERLLTTISGNLTLSLIEYEEIDKDYGEEEEVKSLSEIIAKNQWT